MNQPVKPQPGPQELYTCHPARIVFFGGQVGGGKTFGTIMAAGRLVHIPVYNFVLFRRQITQIQNPGGLWDQTQKVFPQLDGLGTQRRRWEFPSGASGLLSGMEYEDDRYKWDGTEIPFFGFEEVQGFTENQFWYMFSRNRVPTGEGSDQVKPVIRASCNPLPDCWLSRLLQWWWDPDTGYAIPERSGKVRWIIRDQGEIIWLKSKEEAKKYGRDSAVSISFISSRLEDNPKMLEANPGYEDGLGMLNRVEYERLRLGNWKIRAETGDYFPRDAVGVVPAAPIGGRRVRAWDQAATEPSQQKPDPDWTVGVKMSVTDGVYYIEHVNRFRGNPNKVNRSLINTAQQDGQNCWIGLYQDPGAAGKSLVSQQTFMLSGFVVKKLSTTKDKETQARPLSAQWIAGNVKLVRGDWNEAFLDEMEKFGVGSSGHDDQVDAAAGAFNILASHHDLTLFGFNINR